MKNKIENYLLNLIHPDTNQKFISKKNIKEINIENNIKLSIELNYPSKNFNELYSKIISEGLLKLTGLKVSVTIKNKILTHKAQQGGVGKSSTAVNLALSLSDEGANVGILDADIYGPSQPLMLGVHEKPKSKDGKSMEPIMAHNIQVMSIGFLVDQETPMVWRGPIATSYLEQLLRNTKWDSLDYLIIDLPPGTGDIQLTLAQKIPVTGSIIVTTPQDIALLDARRGLKMFDKVNIPIIGIVENMATHLCSECGHEEHIFGEKGGQKMSTDYDCELLGSLPLDISIRENLDNGVPSVAKDSNSKISKIYKLIALKATLKIAKLSEDYTNKFPNIVIQKS